MFKDLIKQVEKVFSARVLILLAIIVVVVAIGIYSGSKGAISELLRNQGNVITKGQAEKVIHDVQDASRAQAAAPQGQNAGPAPVSGMGAGQVIPTSCNQKPIEDPATLLPKDQNSAWAALNPSGTGSLQNVNLLKAGYNIGIDTVGSSLRNANLQVRSEPANPQLNVGPWNNTTIQPDLMRVPLEIGCGPQ